jgi:hypothetical protein
MENYQFNFDTPPAQPTSCSPLADVFAWALWKAVNLKISDLLIEQSNQGLVVAHFQAQRRQRGNGRCYRVIACFPHLRGSPLQDLPPRAAGTVKTSERRWNVCSWTALKSPEDPGSLCTVVQLRPGALV